MSDPQKVFAGKLGSMERWGKRSTRTVSLGGLTDEQADQVRRMALRFRKQNLIAELEKLDS